MVTRAVITVMMTLTVVWNLYGFASNFSERAWGRAVIPVTLISYVLNAAFVVALPLSRSAGRWTVVVSATLGLLMAVWSIAGLLATPAGVEIASGVPGALGAGVPAVLGAVIFLLGLWALRS